MGKSQRIKGKSGEREAAIALRGLWPDCHSLPTGSETREGQIGRDLGHTEGFCVQVKKMGAPTPIRGLYEARKAVSGDEIPICVARRTLAPKGQDGWTVTMGLDDFIKIAYIYLNPF